MHMIFSLFMHLFMHCIFAFALSLPVVKKGDRPSQAVMWLFVCFLVIYAMYSCKK